MAKKLKVKKVKEKKKVDAFLSAEGLAAADVHVVVLVDESGSMGFLTEAVVAGVNRLTKTFREGDGQARVSVGFFDANPGSPRTRFLFSAEPAAKAPELSVADYRPRGLTPLYDAIVDSVNVIDEFRSGGREGGSAPEGEVVFFAIVTDGLENASETTLEGAKAALATLEQRGDSVVFLGANIHAEGVATDLGLGAKGQSFNFTASAGGTQSAFSTASSLGQARRMSGSGLSGQAVYASQAAAEYDSIGGVIPEADDDEDAS